MRFILVNGRIPCARSFCVMCDRPLSGSYLREIATQLTYCDRDCYTDHCDCVVRLLDSREGLRATGREKSRSVERIS